MNDLVRLEDLRYLAVLCAGSALATATPTQLDETVAANLFRLYGRIRRSQLSTVAHEIETTLPERRGQGARLAELRAQMRLEDFWGRLRGIGPRRWRPEIELEGFERVQRARARGRGVVLWCTRTASATAIKQAFHRAGAPLAHLSRANHGVSWTTKFAVGIVGPLYCRAENCYLAERVTIPVGGSLAYFKQLRAQLRGNACLSIFGEHLGRQNAEVPFLGATRSFATGAPSLAWSEGASLLMVHCFRTAPLRYRVVIDEPLDVDRSIGRKQFAERAVGEFARRLEAVIRERPEDWQGWTYPAAPS